MNSKELIGSLINSNFVKSEIPMQLEMGLPYVRKTAGGAAISFMPHKELRRGSCTDIYPHSFEVEWAYPFNHVSYFKNLSLYAERGDDAPLCTIDDETMLSSGLALINKLYEELDNILEHLEEDRTISDIAITNYQKTYLKTAQALGLEKLYFGENS